MGGWAKTVVFVRKISKIIFICVMYDLLYEFLKEGTDCYVKKNSCHRHAFNCCNL